MQFRTMVFFMHLIDCVVFYAESAVFLPCNGGRTSVQIYELFCLNEWIIYIEKALRMYLKRITSYPLDLKSAKSETGSSSLELNAVSHTITV